MLLPVQELQCCRCGTVVQCPFLPGEHRYGEFVVHGAHGYLNVVEGIGGSVWEFVRAIAGDDGLTTEITARLCDVIDGQGFSLELFCPACRSIRWRGCPQRIKIAEIETPAATFAGFCARAEDVRAAQVNSVAREVRETGLYRAGESRRAPWAWRLMDGWRRVETEGVGGLFRRLKAWLADSRTVSACAAVFAKMQRVSGTRRRVGGRMVLVGGFIASEGVWRGRGRKFPEARERL